MSLTTRNESPFIEDDDDDCCVGCVLVCVRAVLDEGMGEVYERGEVAREEGFLGEGGGGSEAAPWLLAGRRISISSLSCSSERRCHCPDLGARAVRVRRCGHHDERDAESLQVGECLGWAGDVGGQQNGRLVLEDRFRSQGPLVTDLRLGVGGWRERRREIGGDHLVSQTEREDYLCEVPVERDNPLG